jgi:hypothetical protein
MQGILIIQKHNKKISLIGLDKGVYVGPLESPERDLSFTTDEIKKLEESWEFYTGHG